MTAITQTIAALNTKVTALDTKVTALDTKLSSLSTTVEALATKAHVGALVKHVDEIESRATPRMDALMSHIAELKDMQGLVYEHAMRSTISQHFGERFARPFSVMGLRGLIRLVTLKTRDESDIDSQLENESRVVEYLRGNVEEHASCLEKLAVKEKPARAAELKAFVAKARDLSKDVGTFSAFCESDRALTLALFCAKYIYSRPLSEMEFDCHGDVVVSQTAAAPPHGGSAQHTRVVRQLEFKRADVSEGVQQAFEHIAAEIAVIRILDRTSIASGVAFVLSLKSSRPQRPSKPVSAFDDDILLDDGLKL